MTDTRTGWSPARVPAPRVEAAAGSPYMFLAHYGLQDRHLFFGRRREAAVLLSDIISARLVVLFARTGRGKTSLINAGVRPRLEELGYRTFYIRVERDPVEAVGRALRTADPNVRDADAARLPAILEAVVNRLGSPVVLFLDQFEEFFINLADETGQARSRAFIDAVAELYGDRQSGVHIVFSMREEYFVEMDAFREAIPSIFSADSSLRLLGLDPAQAREALMGPARHAGVRVDDDLADRVIADLASAGYVEPARLQIVCDSLWARHQDDRITLADYEALGGALRILDERLGEDIDALEEWELDLFERVVPELRTERRTKYRREFSELVHRLDVPERQLGDLVDHLVEMRLVRAGVWRGVRYVEWTSDYLAERTEHLSERARGLRLGRRVASAVTAARAAARAAGTAVSLLRPRVDGSPLFLAHGDLVEISRSMELLPRLGVDELEVLLLAALEHRVDMADWVSRSLAGGLDAWTLLRGQLDHPELVGDRGEATVLALRERADPAAMRLLEHALPLPGVGPAAAEALGRLCSAEAVAILAAGLAAPEPVPSRAIDVLRRMATESALEALGAALRDAGGAVALRAGVALTSLATAQGDEAVSSRAARVLDRVLAGQELRLLDAALQHGLDARMWFDAARERGVDPWPLLSEAISGAADHPDRARNTVRLLVDLPGSRAELLLQAAQRHDAVAATAARTVSARRTLQQSVVERKRPPPHRPKHGVARALTELQWTVFVRSVVTGACVPVLGHGAAPSTVPPPDEIARKWTVEYGLPRSAESDLASAAHLLSVKFDPLFAKELLARELSVASRRATEDPEHRERLLVDMPFSSYLTCTYDGSLESALASASRRPRVVTLDYRSRDVPDSSYEEAGLDAPVIFHLFGSVEAPESMVLTGDDQLDWLAAVNFGFFMTEQLRHSLGRQLLYVGLSPYSWQLRLLRTLYRYHGYLTPAHLIQLVPPDEDEAAELLEREMSRHNGFIYWGTAAEFAAELRERLAAFSSA